MLANMSSLSPLDRMSPQPGYWANSSWPVECGGNRRQKAAVGRLDAARGTAQVVTNRNDRWNVMTIERDPGEWFVGGTMPAFNGPPPFGWVQCFDTETLEPIVSSPELPCGDHVWCGAIVAHANGSIYSVNGSYLHRLDPVDLSVLAERRLPVDRAHNGLLVLSDGTLITKDLRLEGQGGTTISRFEPERLDLIDAPVVLPEGSILIIRTTSNQSNRSASVVVESSRPRSMFPNTQWRLLGIRSTAGSPAYRPQVSSRLRGTSTFGPPCSPWCSLSPANW